MIYIIILVAVFFIIGALSNDDESVSDNTATRNYSYTTKLEGKYLHLSMDTIPYGTEVVILELAYQGQNVKSYYDIFNDEEGNFITGARNNDNNGPYSISVPINALILPRNKDITLDFNITLLKDGVILDKLKSQEEIRISSSSFLLMEWFIPTIKILAYYSIKKGDSNDSKSWSKDNIKVIKNVFSNHIESNPEERDFLKNQMKILSGTSIDLRECVKDFNNRANTTNDKNTIFYASARIIINNLESGKWLHIEKGLAEIKNLSKLMGISNEILEDVYSVFETLENQDKPTEASDNLKALKVLGLLEGATIDEMRRAYRLKIKDFHPDKYTHLPESVKLVLQEKAQELNLAKETLRF